LLAAQPDHAGGKLTARNRSVSVGPGSVKFPPEYGIVQKELRSVLAMIASRMKTPDRLIVPVMQHITSSPGGLIRPALVLLAAKCSGCPRVSAVKVAAIVEMIHTATLLHDDVIDHAATRRGRPSVSSLWGNDCAILAGDWLLADAFGVSGELHSIQISGLLAETAQAMCRGELTQNLLRDRWDITQQTYQAIIENKTASFFSACCALGVVVSKGRPAPMRRLARFGLEFGMAFQHADDLLDIIDDEKTALKQTGSDIANGKPTLAFIVMLERLDRRHRDTAIKKLRTRRHAAADFLVPLRQTGAMMYAFDTAVSHIEKAIAALGPIADSDAGLSLVRIAHSVIAKIAPSRLA
jgi:octaprenyl-diphosphate synthase